MHGATSLIKTTFGDENAGQIKLARLTQAKHAANLCRSRAEELPFVYFGSATCVFQIITFRAECPARERGSRQRGTSDCHRANVLHADHRADGYGQGTGRPGDRPVALHPVRPPDAAIRGRVHRRPLLLDVIRAHFASPVVALRGVRAR